MDFEMIDYKDSDSLERYWDFRVTGGKMQTVDHNTALEQRSIIAVFLQRGSVPQIPGAGNQWAELLTGQVMPQQVNSQVYNSISDMTGSVSFAPSYKNSDGKLSVEVKPV